ncbi:MAG: lipoyl(octanoyl) transferase LipB [Alphaproteobacteria bacterium]|nr:lipoyl(octanoyl) transferase LipB [Alphaproteobacteria bacterium]
MSKNFVEWKIENKPIPYEKALSFMEKRVDDIRKGIKPEMIWILEHPDLYTAGTSAQQKDLLEPSKFPVFKTGRGGQYTYHGPGQRIIYVMLNLSERNPDIRWFVSQLEKWIIETLKEFGIQGLCHPERIGIWVKRPDKGMGYEDKIAALGIRIRKWVSFHGIALNINPNLENFSAIVPCGINNPFYGVTSFVDLGYKLDVNIIDQTLRKKFLNFFN